MNRTHGDAVGLFFFLNLKIRLIIKRKKKDYQMDINRYFSDFCRLIARLTGRPITLTFAFGIIIVWIITGPMFDFSDTWQLVINTGTSVITFLMVFLIQNTQNRDSEAIQIKLDELIRAHQGAHNALLDLEELTEEQLIAIKAKYEKLAAAARAELAKGVFDTDTKDVD
jgi:low affinity Fe/Cu permease